MSRSDIVLEMKDITKRFPGVLALDRARLELRKGEVHVLLGENGAGKSTLMKVLSGNYRADEGEIFLNGEKVHITDPHTAQKLGISMIHQELLMADNVEAVSYTHLDVYKRQGERGGDRRDVRGGEGRGAQKPGVLQQHRRVRQPGGVSGRGVRP